MSLRILSSERMAHLTEIEGFVTPLLHYLPRSIPDYTPHGVSHSENLLRLLENFRENCDDDDFSEDELFLLMASPWLHDVGCLITPQEKKTREHAKMSAILLESTSFDFIQNIIPKDLLTCVSYIILSHQSDYDFASIPRETIHYKVRLPLICAIFRLLDACDIAASRINPNLFNILTERDLLCKKNSRYWEAHSAIVSVVFEGDMIVIWVEDKEKASLYTDHFGEDLESINDIFNEYPKWEPFKFKIIERIFDWKDDL